MGIVDNLLNAGVTPYATVVATDEGPDTVMDGDIMLASGTYAFSALIKLGTKSPWSHCAIVFPLDSIGRVVVLESVESIGLRAVPLISYVRDYKGDGTPYTGTVVLARSTELRSKLAKAIDNVKKITEFAFDDLGHPYATAVIAQIAARIAAGAIGVKAPDVLQPKGGVYICSEFVDACAADRSQSQTVRLWFRCSGRRSRFLRSPSCPHLLEPCGNPRDPQCGR